MKILIVAPFPLEKGQIKGGIESVAFNLMQGFSLIKDAEVLVLSFHRELVSEIQRKLYPNVTIKHLPYGRIKSKKIEFCFHARKLLYQTAMNADIIHIQGSGSNLLLYKKSFSAKLIVTQHGILEEERKHLVSHRQRTNHILNILIEKHYRKKIKHWVYISEYNRFLAKRYGVENTSEALIHNPVNNKFFVDHKSSSQLINTIYYLGKINYLKGLYDLLKALYMLNQKQCVYKLHVIGGYDSETYKTQILNYIKNHFLEEQLVFHGWKNAEEIISITKDISVFVLPSYQETLPVAVAEAMAMGKIIIATRIGGIPEMVTDKVNGFLYERGNVASLAEVLHQLTLFPEPQIAEIRRNAKTTANNMFSPHIVAVKTMEFYRSILLKDT